MIHKYQLNGYFIVLDVNSGAVHVVDELSYRLLDLMEDAVPEQRLDAPLGGLLPGAAPPLVLMQQAKAPAQQSRRSAAQPLDPVVNKNTPHTKSLPASYSGKGQKVSGGVHQKKK